MPDIASFCILAEVADKMNSPYAIAPGCLILAGIALLLGLFRWWLFFILMPLIIWVNYGLVMDPFNDFIIAELGREYIDKELIAWNMPFVAAFAVVLLVHQLKSKNKSSSADKENE
jgi:hypothetical protein